MARSKIKSAGSLVAGHVLSEVSKDGAKEQLGNLLDTKTYTKKLPSKPTGRLLDMRAEVGAARRSLHPLCRAGGQPPPFLFPPQLDRLVDKSSLEWPYYTQLLYN